MMKCLDFSEKKTIEHDDIDWARKQKAVAKEKKFCKTILMFAYEIKYELWF